MAVTLTGEQIKSLFDAADKAQASQNAAYYDGDQAILQADEKRADGSARTRLVENLIEMAVDEHVSFATGTQINYTIDDENADAAALDQLKKIYRENGVAATDSEHFKNSLVQGWGIEVISFDSEAVNGDEKGMIVIQHYDPRNWVEVLDTNGDAAAWIYKRKIPKSTWDAKTGAIIEDERTEYTVYDDASIQRWMDGDDGLKVVEQVPHAYGVIPVVKFATSADERPLISPALITQQDAHNDANSDLRDSVRYDIDALLVMKGWAPDALLEPDKNGITPIQKMRANKALVFPEKDGSADFITKQSDVEKIKLDLDRRREAFFTMAKLADTARMVGVTGATSGIALKLKLRPQITFAMSSLKFFEASLRRRITVINAIWTKLKRPLLENLTIKFTLEVPANEFEKYQSLPYVTAVMTDEDAMAEVGIQDAAGKAERKREQAAQAQEEMNAEVIRATPFGVDASADAATQDTPATA